MDLALSDAARLLRKSERQLRYMIKEGRLAARKVDGRWVIPRDALPLSEQQVTRGLNDQARIKDIVETAFGTSNAAGGEKRRYSVGDLVVFRSSVAILAELQDKGPAAERAARRLTEAVSLITCGCHTFYKRDKLVYLQRAREQLCYALTELLVSRDPALAPLAVRMEGETLPSLGGTLRAAERRK